MASIKRENGPRGPRWRVAYRRPDGSPTSKRFDRRHAAEDFAAEVEHTRRAGTYVDPAGPRTTVADMTARWAATAAHKPSTIYTRDGDLKNHVLPALGRHRLGQVTPLELRAFMRELEAKMAPSTAARIWSWVSAIFAAAVEAGMLARSPAAGLGWPKVPRPSLVPLDSAQVEALRAHMPAHYQPAVSLAADAGLRLGEVTGLTPERIGFLARQRVIRVERQLRSQPAPAGLALPKGDHSRVVPVPEATTEALAEHLARFSRARVPDRVSGGTAELVFATNRGGPVLAAILESALRRAAAQAGLPPGIRFHDLRHYYAAVLIDAGLAEREIGIRLGHSAQAVTARYGHLFPTADDRTRAAVEAAIAARRDPKLGRDLVAAQSDAERFRRSQTDLK
ncbi:MAG: tyrosine-type recombinase/integrase [Acidimicrobiaceae bacterium]|nr:tyrosine-type recombinase/integrase [Acidimicrobiaceae bacterium]